MTARDAQEFAEDLGELLEEESNPMPRPSGRG